jgi:spore coat protein CotF
VLAAKDKDMTAKVKAITTKGNDLTNKDSGHKLELTAQKCARKLELKTVINTNEV